MRRKELRRREWGRNRRREDSASTGGDEEESVGDLESKEGRREEMRYIKVYRSLRREG